MPAPHIVEALARERRRRWLEGVFNLFTGLRHERIHFLFFDERGEARGNLYFDGCINAAQFDLALVLRSALLRDASSIVVAHNHPGGRPEPSSADVASTLRIIEACKMVGISCSDHLIVAAHNIFSFREQGLM
ncbi:JAB domain-containing protein [Sphingobium cupriresistens]|uniref:JAB domain-containing protein n=1 Tax=Sphingobium cupriresistens TaxID=1132417 RepID=UPI001C10E6B7|nr:JAB domain-containing protein [Sphingobium cupriresistens]